MTSLLFDAVIVSLPLALLTALVVEILAADPGMIGEMVSDSEAFALAPVPVPAESVPALAPRAA